MVKIIPMAAAVAALAAFPGMAQAGTATDTKSATFTVAEQCSVKGATVYLGSFRANETWNDMGLSLGYTYLTTNQFGSQSIREARGTKGTEYANWGSVTCTAGMRYSLRISAPGEGFLRLSGHPTRTVRLKVFVKRVGDVVQTDDTAGSGFGVAWGGYLSTSHMGTGTEQVLRGSAVLYDNVDMNSAIGFTGTMSGPVEYELTF